MNNLIGHCIEHAHSPYPEMSSQMPKYPGLQNMCYHYFKHEFSSIIIYICVGVCPTL